MSKSRAERIVEMEFVYSGKLDEPLTGNIYAHSFLIIHLFHFVRARTATCKISLDQGIAAVTKHASRRSWPIDNDLFHLYVEFVLLLFIDYRSR